ncbi:AAA family ATPase [Sulfitobacter sp. M57]|nr:MULTISPECIES: AAA family ATPase [unclassified Sulfitobacter]MDF3545740.1 AAA family ATPase [Sulfitobacter sp. M72]MDF3415880.1 AAA family ATPase [Sulfitobacter sp. KE5]MDF3423360.1 AAA family ATPase [Sulfitobacter sp. KE43]MDF3434426.1 AAA family ATPase [Sulfitobacter sp. KE42]MDF3460066.1 AAA family ATPase [Sulfitobacter sp. S74]
MPSPGPQISEFLARIGLSHLLDLFAAEDIDMPTLRMLDKADLKELGLTLGQRKKLLAALETLPDPASPAPPQKKAPEEAPLQLRRISVLFCDIVGSTELSQQHSIEDMQVIMQHYYQVATEIAKQRDGYLVGSQGDGVVILFGYPRVLDGFAERCVQAAQDLQRALAERLVTFDGRASFHIPTRIGIATGQAAVGQSSGDTMQLVGPVVNRAARLQTVANPQSIVVDSKTQHLTRNAVLYSEVEAHDLKGLPSGTEVFHVLGLRHEVEGPAAPAALIGRDTEASTLRQLWTHAQAGAPVTITITGDAGIGKSTLIHSFLSIQTNPSMRVLHLHCAAMGTRSPLLPVAKALETLTTGGPTTPSLASLLGEPKPELLIRAAQFLGLDTPSGNDVAVSLRDRESILDLLSRWIIRGAAGPTLVFVENAQWADESTRELLKRTAQRARKDGAVLMIVAATRPDSADIWEGQDGHEVMTLQPLNPRHCEKLLQGIFGAKPIPHSIRDNILSHSGGNPLMLETLGNAQAARHQADIASIIEIPHTIYESVSKRLDGIRMGRSVIEALAVLDSPSSPELLAAVLDQDPDTMQPAIDALRQTGLIQLKGTDGQTEAVIRHQVYRDVIYEQIVGKSRRKLHAAALSALQTYYDDPALQRPDLLATHAHVARNWENTVILALKAGESLLKRSALLEAGHFLEMANAAIQRLPETSAHKQEHLRIITGLASVERSRFGIATDASADLGTQAVQLARELGDSKTELLALNGLYAHSLVRANYPRAQEYAETLLETARRNREKTFVMIGTRAIGAVAFHRSDQVTAQRNLNMALSQYDKEAHLHLAHAHGYDHAEICAVFLCMSNWLTGDLRKSRHFGTFSIEHSREIGHAHSMAQAMAFRVMLGALARHGTELSIIASEAIELGEKHDIRVMRAVALLFPFVTHLCLRPEPPKPAEMSDLALRIKEFRKVNPFNYGPLLASLIADVSLRANDIDGAEAALSEGAALEMSTGETWTAPELLRLRAQVAAARGEELMARQLRQEALASATRAGALTLALRAQCDIAMADPGPDTVQAVQKALLKMASDDQGWDTQRAATLVQTLSPA